MKGEIQEFTLKAAVGQEDNMATQILIEIANLIVEKVKQYISEVNSLDEETFVWVDWDARCVHIGKADEEHEGDKIPVCDFIYKEGDTLMPDYDLIDTYAASEWPSYRGD